MAGGGQVGWIAETGGDRKPGADHRRDARKPLAYTVRDRDRHKVDRPAAAATRKTWSCSADISRKSEDLAFSCRSPRLVILAIAFAYQAGVLVTKHASKLGEGDISSVAASRRRP